MNERSPPAPEEQPLAEPAEPATEAATLASEAAKPPAEAVQVSAGALLRQAREASGLHIAALAVALKVPVKKLESLEADQLDQLPDAVFVRALTASVCRHLKVDSGPILERLPKTTAPRLEPSSSSLNSPFRAPGDVAKTSATQALSRRALLAVFVLLVGAIVLLLIPQRRAQTAVEAVSAPLPLPAVVQPPAPTGADPSAAAASEPSLSATTSAAQTGSLPILPGAAAAPAAAVPPATSPPAASPAVAALPATPAPVVAASPAVASPGSSAAPARPGLVTFASRGESWVEVTDATGVVTLRRILNAGDAVSASGVLPLSVVVGRADLTDVTVRGRPFDTGRFARDNVARFEVK